MHRKRIIVLGSTGSIGQSAIAVLRSQIRELKLVGLSAHTNEELLLEQAEEFGVENLALSGRKPLSEKIGYQESEGLLRMIEETDADLVLNGISGSYGLKPSVKILETGKDLALANKETVVMGGEVVKALAERRDCTIIPVDSEHSAIFHLLRMVKKEHLAEVILTASGGAFRDLSLEELKYVTAKQALVHPTWSMGVKITIDSASMANKGLEIIESHHLFGVGAERIKVVLHPQSFVHSLVRTIEGSLYAQISKPDMRIPIQNAFTYPDLYESYITNFDLFDKKLEFSKLDFEKYRMLKIAFDVLGRNGAYPIVYNAANEVAVAAFLKGRISFLDIPAVVEETLSFDWGDAPRNVDEVLDIHAMATAKTPVGH
jgi:1-deoxy-D-xylulose-5-phosphate reductoisomerase